MSTSLSTRGQDEDQEKTKTSKAKFKVPSVSDIREAGKISSQSEPSIFRKSKPQAEKSDAPPRAVTAHLSTELPPKQQLSSVSRDHEKHTNINKATPAPKNHSETTSIPVSALPIGESSKVKLSAPDEGGGCETAAPHKPFNPRAIIVNIVQKNNPVIKHIRNVPWEFGDIVPDFELGRTVCALFLSVRYHALHPDYIHTRLKELGKQYELRILLVYVDTSESHHALQELAKMALLADLTLILAWSPEEAGRYLETYKAYENKPPDLIMERTDSDFSSRVIDSLTTVKKVNKTDAATLFNNFKTMEQVIKASKDDLTLCPGLGPQKAQRLYDLFREPFLRTKKPRTDTT